MGGWYWIGVAAGIGAGAGIAIGSLVAARRLAVAAGLAVALAAGVGVGQLVGAWPESAGGASGGLLGAASSVPVVAGSLRAGGTRLGVAALVGLAGVVVAALGFVPGLGYAEAVAAPLFAARLRRRGDRRHAGLRILAKD